VLTRYFPKGKVRKEKNLLSGDEDDVEEEVREWDTAPYSTAQFFIS
jgi:hypothetical protein